MLYNKTVLTVHMLPKSFVYLGPYRTPYLHHYNYKFIKKLIKTYKRFQNDYYEF